VALTNLQKYIDNIDKQVYQKPQMHMATIKASQANKATQDQHTQQFEMMTKTLNLLVYDFHLLLDNKLYPTPMIGIGESY